MTNLFMEICIQWKQICRDIIDWFGQSCWFHTSWFECISQEQWCGVCELMSNYVRELACYNDILQKHPIMTSYNDTLRRHPTMTS